MNNGLKLFRAAAIRSALTKQSSTRKLYTDHIYPYPFEYFNNEVYPSRNCYRETYPDSPWLGLHTRWAKILMRVFWTGFWYQMFWHPEVLTGHFTIPDPTLWTDAELGIPPDDVGPYTEWLANKISEEAD